MKSSLRSLVLLILWIGVGHDASGTTDVAANDVRVLWNRVQ